MDDSISFVASSQDELYGWDMGMKHVSSGRVTGVDEGVTLKYLLTSQTFGSQKPFLKVFGASSFICHQIFILQVHNALDFSDLV